MALITGAGNTTVLFLSTPISTWLCRLRSCSEGVRHHYVRGVAEGGGGEGLGLPLR